MFAVAIATLGYVSSLVTKNTDREPWNPPTKQRKRRPLLPADAVTALEREQRHMNSTVPEDPFANTPAPEAVGAAGPMPFFGSDPGASPFGTGHAESRLGRMTGKDDGSHIPRREAEGVMPPPQQTAFQNADDVWRANMSSALDHNELSNTNERLFEPKWTGGFSGHHYGTERPDLTAQLSTLPTLQGRATAGPASHVPQSEDRHARHADPHNDLSSWDRGAERSLGYTTAPSVHSQNADRTTTRPQSSSFRVGTAGYEHPGPTSVHADQSQQRNLGRQKNMPIQPGMPHAATGVTGGHGNAGVQVPQPNRNEYERAAHPGAPRGAAGGVGDRGQEQRQVTGRETTQANDYMGTAQGQVATGAPDVESFVPDTTGRSTSSFAPIPQVKGAEAPMQYTDDVPMRTMKDLLAERQSDLDLSQVTAQAKAPIMYGADGTLDELPANERSETSTEMIGGACAPGHASTAQGAVTTKEANRATEGRLDPGSSQGVRPAKGDGEHQLAHREVGGGRVNLGHAKNNASGLQREGSISGERARINTGASRDVGIFDGQRNSNPFQQAPLALQT